MVSFKEEKKLLKSDFQFIVGLDEAGRGPLAGPVVAAAVAVKDHTKHAYLSKVFLGIKDSKKLSEAKREIMYQLAIRNPWIDFGIGIISEKIIDRINIFKATKLAMKQALENLIKKNGKSIAIDCLIIDGNFTLDNLKQGSIVQKSIIKADEKVFSCVLAGIVAKVTRDRIMKKYDKKYPHYGFNQHKGYGTLLHREKIEQYGFCRIHRKTFQPIKDAILLNP